MDGSIAFYEATIGPWLRYLTLRRNSRLFQEKDLHTQASTILQDYLTLPDWDWRVRGNDPVMTMACQFEEHDHNYLHRRLEAAGYLYWYEHTAGSHKLIVTDTSGDAAAIDGSNPQIPFHGVADFQGEDGIRSWSLAGRAAPTSYTVGRFDFKNPRPVSTGLPTLNNHGTVPAELEQYEYTGAYGFGLGQAGEDLAKRRLEEIEATAETFEGQGNNRYVMPGRQFELINQYGQSLYGDGEKSTFLIVAVRHSVTNNYLQGTNGATEYSNELTCIRRNVPWRPGRGFNSVDTKILAPQTAIVVGPSGQSIFTDEYGRVRIQFHWDREARGNEASSTWVRASSSWAGGENGMSALPRAGSEVIVQHLDGNPDRPIITGRVANETNMPPWKLPEQGALMGFRSRELNGASGNAAGGRSSQLIFDDTANQIQTQLRSDHEHSQLSLGYVTRVEDTSGRQDARGEGFELRTDAVGAIRSARGMLISTDARPQAKSHLADISEPAGRLAKSQTLHAQLEKLAQQSQAQDSGSDQGKVADTLKSQNDSIKGGGTGGDDSFPELRDPYLLLASASGIVTTAPGSTHISSGEHVAVTASSNVSIAAGKSMLASVSEKFSLFVHRMGIKLIAAAGKVQVQAQNDELELLAKKVVSIISTSDWINITAKQGIKLNAGNSQLVISAEGINGFTPGGNQFHAASHGTMGPQSIPAKFPGSDLCSSLTASAGQAGSASVPLS